MTLEQIMSYPVGTLFNFGIFRGVVDKYNATWLHFTNVLGGITSINILDSNAIKDICEISQEDYDKAKAQYFARMIDYVDNLPHNATV